MARHSVLPPNRIDSRTGAELIQAALNQVYTASNEQINDFSPGSPITALIEGQVFAQEEFLQFANQFPESVLLEWIGPFLGAQRRLGSGSITEVTFTIQPSVQTFTIRQGFQVQTPIFSDGSPAVVFVTQERLVIPPGQTQGTVSAVSVLRSRRSNVPIGSITKLVSSLPGVVGVTNPSPAVGGQNPELIQEVKERFFSIVHRKNPTSREDWEDFFVDILGPGTTTVVLPRRSERVILESNNHPPEPAVSFFVLNPDGTPITSAQQTSLNRIIRLKLPIMFQGFVYPMEVNPVDINLELTYDTTKSYASSLSTLAQTVATQLSLILRPGAVFPLDYTPTVSDLEGALTERFSRVFRDVNRYRDPDVKSIVAYTTPPGLIEQKITANVVKYQNGKILKEDSLVVELDYLGNRTYYRVLQEFSPVDRNKAYHANINKLRLQLIRKYEYGNYATGEIVAINYTLYYVRNDHFNQNNYDLNDDIEARRLQDLINSGTLAGPVEYTEWSVGTDYQSGNTTPDKIPDIIAFQDTDVQYTVSTPVDGATLNIPVTKRPGYPIWTVLQDFTLQDSTSELNLLQVNGFVAPRQTPVSELKPDIDYKVNQYVKITLKEEEDDDELVENRSTTPVNAGTDIFYGRVKKEFKHSLPPVNLPPKEPEVLAKELTRGGFLEPVSITQFVNYKNQNIFSLNPFKYQTRFKIGEYIKTGDKFFFVLKDFTPFTSEIDKLVEAQVISEVPNSYLKTTYQVKTPATSPSILENLREYFKNKTLVEGETVTVVNTYDRVVGVWVYVDKKWLKISSDLPKYRNLTRFDRDDVVSLHDSFNIMNYKVLKPFTPLSSPELYLNSSEPTLEPTQSEKTQNWVDNSYNLEDLVCDEGVQNFYRVIKPFTPLNDDANQSSENSLDTIQKAENSGFLQKIVIKPINLTPRLPDGVSINGFGKAQIKLTSKENIANTKTFYSGGKVEYEEGTLLL